MWEYEVRMVKAGRAFTETVKAANQKEARQIAQARNPGYKATSAKRGKRVKA